MQDRSNNMKRDRFIRRKTRVRARIKNTKTRPRLSVFRSNRFIYAQIIDDSKGETLVSAQGLKSEAEKVGEEIAKKALKRKVKKVVFDKSGYKYHGKVKELADSARKGGLEF